jgi:hypothetical protein
MYNSMCFRGTKTMRRSCKIVCFFRGTKTVSGHVKQYVL